MTFGPGALAFIAFYLVALLAVGWLGRRASREDSLQDFYLGGRGIGFIVLILTLYATQYSGNTFFAFTGRTYRTGYSWIMSLHFMTAIIVCYLLFAPKLNTLAKNRNFITPTDYLHDRFGSPSINLVATLIMVVGISNYLLAQLMAMGRAIEGLTDLDPTKAYLYGVVGLALIIVIYETLGGFRAVAWTDVVQGIILIIGFAILLVTVFYKYGSLRTATETLLADSPHKALPPDWNQCRQWFSYIVLVGLGGALYPQAIQRIYAARSAQTLKKSLAVMAFLPLTTTLIALIVGIMAAAHFSGLDGPGADKILAVVCRQVQEGSYFGYWLVVILFAAILAAMMSTADSVLLSISSMLTKDIYGRFIRPSATDAEMTRLGKILSWILIALLIALALQLREHTTLVSLLDRKFDLLVQLVPAFIIAIHWPRLRSGPTLAGLLVGTAIALILAYIYRHQGSKIFGIHPGLYGLAANLLITVFGSFLPSKRSHQPQLS